MLRPNASTRTVLCAGVGRYCGKARHVVDLWVVFSHIFLCPATTEIFVVGDVCALEQNGTLLPGVAQVAMQEGAQAARNILHAIKGEPQAPFRYRDYGTMAVIGRGSAVADIGPVQASGFFAWIFWLFLHIFWLIGFRNRLAVLGEWAWSYFTLQRRVRLITGEKPPPQ
jgi:NADH dehydrogenase